MAPWICWPPCSIRCATSPAAQFWVACLYNSKPEEMMGGFIGLFRRAHRDRLRTLNRDYTPPSGLHLKDPIGEYIDGSRQKLDQLHEAVGAHVKGGLDRIFAEMVRIVGRLELPTLVVSHFESFTREICEAFSGMDGTVSPKENRFIQYLLKQVGAICRDSHGAAGGTSVPEGEQLDQVLREVISKPLRMPRGWSTIAPGRPTPFPASTAGNFTRGSRK